MDLYKVTKNDFKPGALSFEIEAGAAVPTLKIRVLPEVYGEGLGDSWPDLLIESLAPLNVEFTNDARPANDWGRVFVCLRSKHPGSLHYKGRGPGSARRELGGAGDCRHSGAGFGHSTREHSGAGDAIREGEGAGDAWRGGSGTGNAIRRGEGEGEARRTGGGQGDAIREGRGSGTAKRFNTYNRHKAPGNQWVHGTRKLTAEQYREKRAKELGY